MDAPSATATRGSRATPWPRRNLAVGRLAREHCAAMRRLALAALCATSAACGTTLGMHGTVRAEPGSVQEGYASFYSDRLAGHATASGDRYDPSQYTAAHRTLPFGTRVSVRRVDTGRQVEVRINDRGPFAGPRRIVDLSRAAAEALDMLRAGVVAVTLEVLSAPRR